MEIGEWKPKLRCGACGGQVHPTEHSSALLHELAEVQLLQGDIWGITSYFNPEGYQSKLDNFRLFRKRTTNLQGLPLVVVELTFGDKCDLPFLSRRRPSIATASTPTHVQGCRAVKQHSVGGPPRQTSNFTL